MGLQCTFHAPQGAEFLGWRLDRQGQTEVVYEGAHRRQVLRLAQRPDENLVEALRISVGARHVLPRLIDELKKRAIAVESGNF